MRQTIKFFQIFVFLFTAHPELGTTSELSPAIIVLQPSKIPTASPLNVNIAFFSKENAKIDPDSLKIYYGWFNIDVTERIKRYAHIDGTGITANNIDLPPGPHQFTIEIQDDRKRRAQKQINVYIVENSLAKSRPH